MSGIVGTAGNVLLGTDAIAGIRQWSLDIAATDLSASEFGVDWALTEGGLKEWGGTFEGNADDEDIYQTMIWNHLIEGTLATIKLYLHGQNWFEGSVIISKNAPSQAHDDLAKVSYAFNGKGQLQRYQMLPRAGFLLCLPQWETQSV